MPSACALEVAIRLTYPNDVHEHRATLGIVRNSG
jgi:hypothetical protein